MQTAGTASIYLLLLLSTWTMAVSMVGIRRRSAALLDSARLLVYAVAATATFSFLLLSYAFAVSDFSLVYVQEHSERAMPLFYRVTATWGGMEGSLLLWAWLLALFSAVAIWRNKERLREILPYSIIVLMGVMVFFASLLTITSNPFKAFVAGAPSLGEGLNPLLQNPYMVTHPPSLYLGFVGMTIPFAFAMGALLSGRLDETWIAAARRWAILAWFFLSLGLTLGMLWAYEELGWGGYWGWDPVENAGFMPWLIAAAFIHSIMVQERRQMLKTWNVVLAIVAFAMTIFGTFLTRSGFIQSVHAFARSSIGWVFLGFIGFVLVLGAGLIIWRRPLLRSRARLESVLSREFWFLLNNWVLLTAAVLVMVLTVFPNISALFGEKITISIAAFNRWIVPVGVALLIITGVGPMLGWRATSGEALRRQFLWPIVAGFALAGALVLAGIRRPLPVAAWGICTFVLATIVQEILRAARVRAQAAGVGFGRALGGLFARNRRRYGGYIVHVGIVVMCIGFAGDAFKVEQELMMRPGQRAKVGGYVVRFDGLRETRDDQKRMVTATLSVFDARGDLLGVVRPARWFFNRHEDQPTTEVAIRRNLKEDLFIAMADPRPDGSTPFSLIVNPLVNWVWFGFLVLVLGTVVAALPLSVAGRRRTAAAAGLVLALLLPAIGRAEPAAPKVDPADHARTEPVPLTLPGEREVLSKISCMCGGCPKLPLSRCWCGFAQREREAVRAKLRAGWTEERILDWYARERGPEIGEEPFGDAALGIPREEGWKRLYWVIPYGGSALAVVGLVLVGRRWARRRGEHPHGGEPPRGDGDDPYRELVERELRDME